MVKNRWFGSRKRRGLVFFGRGRVNSSVTLMALEREFYACDADVTHTDNSAEFGYGVPDGKIDSDDFYAYIALFDDESSIANLTTTGYITPGGSPPNGVPDATVNNDDFCYFIAFYADCENQPCAACP